MKLQDVSSTTGAEESRKRRGYGTLTRTAHELIRKSILDERLAAGERITIKQLQKDLGIGPTPIREALSQLSSEGFVVGEEHRGYRITALSLDSLRDVTDQRKLIECEGLRRSILFGDNSYFENVASSYSKLSALDDARRRSEGGAFEKWEGAHREYHRALIGGANSEWLARFQELLFDHADRYRRKSVEQAPPADQIVKDHRMIMESVLDHDVEMASLLLARHIERVFTRAREWVKF